MTRLLSISNHALVICLLALIVSIIMAYPLADTLSLPAQIAMHMGTLLFAIGIKLAYIARIVSLKALGRPIG